VGDPLDGLYPRTPANLEDYTRMMFANSRVRDVAIAVAMVAVNIWMLREFLSFEYGNHFSSIEGSFIAFARVLVQEHFRVSWWPYWHGGMPIEHVYVPAFHYLVAFVSLVGNLPPAVAYHATAAVAYSVGAGAVYLFGRALSECWRVALLAALLYTLISSSGYFVPGVFPDMGGHIGGRRVQVLYGYGESPHVFSLALQALALAALHLMLNTRKRSWAAVTVLMSVLTIASNTPGSMALVVGGMCVLLAHGGRVFQWSEVRLLFVSLILVIITSVAIVPISYWQTVIKNSTEMHRGFAGGGLPTVRQDFFYRRVTFV